LTGLVKTIDKQLQETRAIGTRSLGVYVIFCNNDPKMKERLESLITKEEWKQVVICTHDPKTPSKYQVAEEADLTVVVYENRRVSANFPLRKGALDDNKVKEIRNALTRVLPRK